MVKQLTNINQVTLRYNRPHITELQKITHPSIAIEILRSFIDDALLDHREFFWVLLLTGNNQLLGISEICVGTINKIILSPREIMQLALLSNAVGIVLIHNHPSGVLKPSKEDIENTKIIKAAGELMDVHLRDHLIITSESYTSIRGIEGW